MYRARAALPIAIALIAGVAHSEPDRTMVTVAQRDRLRSAGDPAAASLSADGRFLAFTSYVSLSPLDTDVLADVYVVNLATGVYTLESVAADGWAVVSDCSNPRVSGDGSYLVFEAALQTPRGIASPDVIYRDRTRDRSIRVSRSWTGENSNGGSGSASISDDGRTVVFQSAATNLVPEGDTNGAQPDVYSYDFATERTRRVSVDASGAQAASGMSAWPAISGDGHYVSFVSSAELAPSGMPRAADGNRPAVLQLYLRDLRRNATVRVSTSPSGEPGNHSSQRSAISSDGGYVAFVSDATNLVSGDHNRGADVFLYERATGTITAVSRGVSGGTANGASANPAISSNGALVAFQSQASNLLCAGRCQPPRDDINLVSDVFLFDRRSALLERVSAGSPDEWLEESVAPALDGTGRILAFSSKRPTDALDAVHDFDLFVRMPDARR